MRLKKLASNIFEKKNYDDNKESNVNLSEEEIAIKEAKLLQKHNEMKELLNLEKAKEELNQIAYIEDKKIKENSIKNNKESNVNLSEKEIAIKAKLLQKHNEMKNYLT